MNDKHASESIKPFQPAHWGVWMTILWSAVVAAVFLVLQTATLVADVIVRNPGLPESEIAERLRLSGENGFALSLATIITAVACCSLIAGIVKLRKGSVLTEYLALRPVATGTMLRWAGYFVVFLALSDLLTTSLGRPIVPTFMQSIYATANPVWLLWIALVLGAPLFEETFFRGFLFRGLEASFLGPFGTVVVTAGLWAVIHVQYDAYDVASIFFMGLFLGAARLFTGSLLVPLGLHALANFLATAETALWG